MAKRILFLVNKDNVIYNFRRELAFELLDRGFDVYISSPYGKKIDYMVERGCQFIDLQIDRRGTSITKDIKLIFHYYKLFKKIKPDVVLAYTSKPAIYGGIGCRLLGIPYIVNNAGLLDPATYPWYVGKALDVLYKVGFPKAACIMFQNCQEREYMRKLLGEKIHYRDIPGSGVNLKEFGFADYPLDKGEIIFNYVARIVKIKGIDELLECAQRIKPRYPQVRFVLYGDFDDDVYRTKVNELQEQGIVEYGGIQMDMKPCIERAHAAIHPSYYEGMTNVILEHGAMGRPSIVSNISGCKEGVDDGKTGFVFEVRDVVSMVNAVEKFIKLSYQDKALMGKAAREKMEREFSRDIVTNVYLEEINRIMHEKD